MPGKTLGLVGVFHEVGFEPAAGNALVENREYLDRLLGFLSEKIGAGELKSIALEANPKALAVHRKFASLLEAQPDPKKLALPKDLSGLPRGKLRDAFEAMVKKHGGDRYRALEFFAIKVYWSRLVSFLDGKNPAGKKIEIVALGSKRLSDRQSHPFRRPAITDRGIRKHEEFGLQRDRFMEKRLARLKKKGMLPDLAVLGLYHLPELGERLEHHSIKYSSTLIAPPAIRELTKGVWRWRLETRDRMKRRSRTKRALARISDSIEFSKPSRAIQRAAWRLKKPKHRKPK